MEETNPREELYQQFKASLKEPLSDRYFSEDELVEIFDYAGDIADDYVQFEVLFCAARLYPESQPLTDRKALFYLDTTESDDNPESPTARAFVADNPELSSPLMDIVRMEVNHPEKPEEALNFFIGQYAMLSDEEIIRLVDLACDMDCYSWVVENLDKLRAKITFAPTLLYELMNRASAEQDFETVLKATEELIEAEPFASGYWATQFRALAQLNRQEEARSSFDYAKSLGASDEETICFLADVIIECAPYLIDEGLEMLDDWLATDPSNYRIFSARGMFLIQKQDFQTLEKDLEKFIKSYGINGQALRHLFLLSNPLAPKYLRSEIQKGNAIFSAEELDDLMDTLHLNCNYSGMNELMEVLSEFMGERLPLPLAQYWIEALYNLGRHDEAVKLFLKYPQEEALSFLTYPPRGPAFWYIGILSLCYTKTRIEQVIDIPGLTRKLIEQLGNSPAPIKLTYKALYDFLDELLTHPADENDTWQNFVI